MGLDQRTLAPLISAFTVAESLVQAGLSCFINTLS
jgi:hypothetical protein